MIQKMFFRNIRNVFPLILATVTLQIGFSQTKPNIFVQHNLVSDVAGQADFTDPNLVNPWGLSASATSPLWVSNHEKGNTTLYNGTGALQGGNPPLVVTIPSGPKRPAISTPTAQASTFGSPAFVLSNGRTASFIFVTEDGTISGFGGTNPAILMVDNSASGAVYKGLAINPTGANQMLYAANFNSGKIDVFDNTWKPITVP